MRESVESKLFGMGVESYTAASHEFSLGYAITRGKVYCLDAGHFHPTEYISDKISAVLQFLDSVLLHLSRGVRWDSDHVVLWDDELQRIMNAVIHNGYEDRVFIGQDYFDASINRIACWAIAMRNTRKALLKAALDPIGAIKRAELEGGFIQPPGAVGGDQVDALLRGVGLLLHDKGKTGRRAVVDEVKRYEREVLGRR